MDGTFDLEVAHLGLRHDGTFDLEVAKLGLEGAQLRLEIRRRVGEFPPILQEVVLEGLVRNTSGYRWIERISELSESIADLVDEWNDTRTAINTGIASSAEALSGLPQPGDIQRLSEEVEFLAVPLNRIGDASRRMVNGFHRHLDFGIPLEWRYDSDDPGDSDATDHRRIPNGSTFDLKIAQLTVAEARARLQIQRRLEPFRAVYLGVDIGHLRKMWGASRNVGRIRGVRQALESMVLETTLMREDLHTILEHGAWHRGLPISRRTAGLGLRTIYRTALTEEEAATPGALRASELIAARWPVNPLRGRNDEVCWCSGLGCLCKPRRQADDPNWNPT